LVKFGSDREELGYWSVEPSATDGCNIEFLKKWEKGFLQLPNQRKTRGGGGHKLRNHRKGVHIAAFQLQCTLRGSRVGNVESFLEPHPPMARVGMGEFDVHESQTVGKKT